MPTETTNRGAVSLPESILLICTEKARIAGRKLEDWISERLRLCQNHDAKRGLYFDDVQREALEQLLGGVMLANADDAIRLLTSRFTLAVGGEKEILVEEGVYTVLKQRSEELGIPLPEIIRQAVFDGLSDSAYGAH